MVIAYPPIRAGNDGIVLQRLELDLEGLDTVEEKEALYDRWAYYLHTMHYPTIVAVGKEPIIYVELQSRMKELEEELELSNQ